MNSPIKNDLRQYYLDSIGIQSWRLKSALEDDYIESEIIDEPPLVIELQPEEKPHVDYSATDSVTLSTVLPVENSQLQSISANREITSDNSDLSQNRTINDNKSLEIKSKADINVSPDNVADSELQQNIRLCKKCPSRNTRLNALTGQGNSKASVFIIAGAPNAEEDRQGHFLLEQPNALLQNMLHSTGLVNNYFFTGLIKCYSLEDYRFSEQDAANCRTYLDAQIAQINPSVILIFGAAEAQSLLGSKQTFNELRGKIHPISINDKDYCVIISYHPAYLLRNPLYKKESLKDLIMVKNLLK